MRRRARLIAVTAGALEVELADRAGFEQLVLPPVLRLGLFGFDARESKRLDGHSPADALHARQPCLRFRDRRFGFGETGKRIVVCESDEQGVGLDAISIVDQ